MTNAHVNAPTLALASSIARYHAGCLRVIGAQNVAQTEVRTAKKAAYPCDLGQLAETEQLLRHGKAVVAPPEPPVAASPAARDRYQQRLAVWERLRELATKAAVEAHQKEVIYAGPLLCGVLWKKNASTCEPVLAPLFLQTATVAAQPDGTVLIAATDEPPRFNTSVRNLDAPRAVRSQVWSAPAFARCAFTTCATRSPRRSPPPAPRLALCRRGAPRPHSGDDALRLRRARQDWWTTDNTAHLSSGHTGPCEAHSRPRSLQ